jgi:hypothetical protein
MLFASLECLGRRILISTQHSPLVSTAAWDAVVSARIAHRRKRSPLANVRAHQSDPQGCYTTQPESSGTRWKRSRWPRPLEVDTGEAMRGVCFSRTTCGWRPCRRTEQTVSSGFQSVCRGAGGLAHSRKVLLRDMR